MPRAEKKSSGKPKRPTSAYAYFVQTVREDHKAQKPGEPVPFGELSKECSEKWKRVSAEQKQHFEQLAEIDKKRYEQELKEYNLRVRCGATSNGHDGDSSVSGANGLDASNLHQYDMDPDSDQLDGAAPESHEKKAGKARKRKLKRDPNVPKRNISAFFFFCEENRPQIRTDHPEWRVGDISKELSKQWEQLTDKSKFEERARTDKQRYEAQISEYNRVKKEQEVVERERQHEADRLSAAQLHAQTQMQQNMNAAVPGTSQPNGKSAVKRKTLDGNGCEQQIIMNINTNLNTQQPSNPGTTSFTELQPASQLHSAQTATLFHNSTTLPAGTFVQTMPNSQMAVLNVQMLPGQSPFQMIPFSGQPMAQMNVSMTQAGNASRPMTSSAPQSSAPGVNANANCNGIATASAPNGQSGMQMQMQMQGASSVQMSGQMPSGANGPFMSSLYAPNGMQMVGLPLQFLTAPPGMVSHDGTTYMQIPIQHMHYISAQHGMQFMQPGVGMGMNMGMGMGMGVGVGQTQQMPGAGMMHVGMQNAPNGHQQLEALPADTVTSNGSGVVSGSA